MRLTPALSLTVLALTTSCATITTGMDQPVTVDTPEVQGASCDLTDTKGGRWILPNTPGALSVTKGNGPMTVSCTKAGYEKTTLVVDEAFAGMTLGNVLLGGGVGVIIDASSGAAQEYPDVMTVWMPKTSWANASEKSAWEARKKAFEDAQKKKEDEQRSSQNPGAKR